MEARPRPDDDRRAGVDPEVDDQWPEVVADRLRSPGSIARQGRRVRAGASAASSTASARRIRLQHDPVVGGDDPAGERRSRRPHVVEVHERPAVGERGDQRLADPPRGQSLDEHQVDELGFRGDPERERRSERHASSRPGGVGECDRKAARDDGCLPRFGHLALASAKGPRRRGARRDASAGGPRIGGGRAGRPRLVVCGTMDEPARNDPSPRGEPHDPTSEPAAAEPVAAAGEAGRDPVAAAAAAHWSAALPPAPFVEIDEAGRRRLAPLSPRVAVLIGAAVVVGLVLWMARDAVRPFIVGLLLVYLLDPPVRWLTRARVPRRVRDPDRLRGRGRRDRGVPQPDASSADQRGDPVHRGLPCPHGAVRRTARAPRRVLRGARHPARPARIHRRGDRGAHDRRIELQPRGPAAARDRRDDLPRRDLCLLPDPGVGLLHPQGPRAAARRRSTARCPPPGGPTPGRRSASSSGCSASGSAGSCCSGSRSA